MNRAGNTSVATRGSEWRFFRASVNSGLCFCIRNLNAPSCPTTWRGGEGRHNCLHFIHEKMRDGEKFCGFPEISLLLRDSQIDPPAPGSCLWPVCAREVKLPDPVLFSGSWGHTGNRREGIAAPCEPQGWWYTQTSTYPYNHSFTHQIFIKHIPCTKHCARSW